MECNKKKQTAKPLQNMPALSKDNQPLVLPGTTITQWIEDTLTAISMDSEEPASIKLGQGLIQIGDCGDVMAVCAGRLLFHKSSRRFWIESHQDRYVPVQNNLVIGVITSKLADSYRVDLGSAHSATLPLMTGFEGSTKKNKPMLNIGDLVFARISMASRDLEPEIVCFGVDVDAPNASAGFGEIRAMGMGSSNSVPSKNDSSFEASMLYRCSCSFSRQLQASQSDLLEELGRHFSFEIIVGANGRFVVLAETISKVFQIGRVIMHFSHHRKVSSQEVSSYISTILY